MRIMTTRPQRCAFLFGACALTWLRRSISVCWSDTVQSAGYATLKDDAWASRARAVKIWLRGPVPRRDAYLRWSLLLTFQSIVLIFFEP